MLLVATALNVISVAKRSHIFLADVKKTYNEAMRT